MAQIIAAKFELRKVANNVFQGALHDWRQWQLADNDPHCSLNGFRTLRGFLSRILVGRRQSGLITLEDFD